GRRAPRARRGRVSAARAVPLPRGRPAPRRTVRRRRDPSRGRALPDLRGAVTRVLVIGEINVDLIVSGCHGAPTPGKEILAERFQAALGSASAICAVGLARLGTDVAFLGKVGADDWGAF